MLPEYHDGEAERRVTTDRLIRSANETHAKQPHHFRIVDRKNSLVRDALAAPANVDKLWQVGRLVLDAGKGVLDFAGAYQ